MSEFRYKLLDISTGEYIYYCFKREEAADVITALVHISQHLLDPKHPDEYEIQEIL